jgi:hypothetical protein
MAIFHSYVSLPEGNGPSHVWFHPLPPWFRKPVSPQVRANSEMRWDIFAHTWDEDLHDAMLGAALSISCAGYLGIILRLGIDPMDPRSQWRGKT